MGTARHGILGTETRRALKGPKGPTRWALKGPKGPTRRALKGPKGANVSFWKNKKPTPPLAPVGFGQKHGFGKIRGHKLAKVLAIRAENPSRHTNSVPLRRIWPSKNLGDG